MEERRSGSIASLVRTARSHRAARAPGHRRRGLIPPHTTVTLLLDRGHLTTAYPGDRDAAAARGASITLTYAEALARSRRRAARRARRATATRSRARSLRACATASCRTAAEPRLFRPLWWRTFRYVEVASTTADEPLDRRRHPGALQAYPFEERGRFESSDPVLSKIWDVGWRTARLCAHETYMDTPYWEQLQYVGDTRIQALLSLYVGGDDRLVQKRDRAVRRVAHARRPHAEPLSRRCCRRSSRRSRCSGSG